jgi:hypothetical protein
MRRAIFILMLIMVLSGCEKFQALREPGKGVEFYYISDYQKIGNTFKINNFTVNLSDSVLIGDEEIISYDPDTYTFRVTGACADRLGNFRTNQLQGATFAVTVNKQLVYTGYFWFSFSSMSVDWITIDPLLCPNTRSLRVSLGYPGIFGSDYIPDNRNDQKLINYLRNDGKLYNK